MRNTNSFLRKHYERPPRPPLRPIERQGKPWTQGPIEPIEKENALQHEGYMNLVRRMACAHCRRPPPSQFCHADEGKGTGIKTDCRRGWPGCADGPGRVGCHTLIGTEGKFSKEQRRALEAQYGTETRLQILIRGAWPKSLPLWMGDA